jgi:hypothetical protein
MNSIIIINNNNNNTINISNISNIFNKVQSFSNKSYFFSDNIRKFNSHENNYFIGILVLTGMLCIILVIFLIVMGKLIKR